MVSAPKMPSNWRCRLVAAVRQGELLVDGQVGVGFRVLRVVITISCLGSAGVAGCGCTAGARRVMRSVELVDDRRRTRPVPGAHGVGDRPVQPAARRRASAVAGGEVFVGVVADGDDQVGRVEDVGRWRGGSGTRVRPSAAGDGDRAGMRPARGVGAGGGGRDRAGVVPQRGRELGAGRVVGAHEHHPLRARAPADPARGSRPARGCREQGA